MKVVNLILIILFVNQFCFGQSDKRFFPKQNLLPGHLPAKHNLWIFLMAGQSNMAGRGLVEPRDTLSNPRILTISQDNKIVVAKEPLHYYEPTRTGLDCGVSFATTLLKSLPDSISLLLIPAAVGGSAIQQWLGDSTWRNVKLLTNTKEKSGIARSIGVFKGVLWHQGEANANTLEDIGQHSGRLALLVDTLRNIMNAPGLPFLVAELGSFSTDPGLFEKLNGQLQKFVMADKNAALIKTGDLTHIGDSLHFNSEAQRLIGERFARAYIARFYVR